MFAADIASKYGLKKVLSFDMGGTTAKICLINDYTPKTSRVFEVARTYRFKKGSGIPISIPVIDMVEIGAGGGSLVTIDSLSQIIGKLEGKKEAEVFRFFKSVRKICIPKQQEVFDEIIKKAMKGRKRRPPEKGEMPPPR